MLMLQRDQQSNLPGEFSLSTLSQTLMELKVKGDLSKTVACVVKQVPVWLKNGTGLKSVPQHFFASGYPGPENRNRRCTSHIVMKSSHLETYSFEWAIPSPCFCSLVFVFVKTWWWLDSNPGPTVSEATTLPKFTFKEAKHWKAECGFWLRTKAGFFLLVLVFLRYQR